VKEFFSKRKADIGLAVLVIYTLTLGVATADELFNLGLFPTKLDKMIAAAVKQLESDDPGLRQKALQDLVEYGDFAVPQLIRALDKERAPQDLVIKALEEIQREKKPSPEAWKKWYQENKDRF